MRIVVFTGDPALEQRPWWRIVMEAPGLTGVLVCRQRVSRTPRDVLRRLRKNIAKHGLIFVPYRIAVLVASLIARRRAGSPPEPYCSPVRTEVLEVNDLHAASVLEHVRQWRPDLGLSLGAPILRPALFRIPTLGTLNLHLGQVPDYRGAPPGFWELYTGASRIGATVHWMDEGLDTGPILAAAQAPIYPADTLARVSARAEELGRRMLTTALARVAAGERTGTSQPVGGRTFRLPTLRQRATLAARIAWRRWTSRIRDTRGVAKTVAAVLWLFAYRPLRDLIRTVRRTHPVRAFTFHRVSNLCRDGLTVPPDVFRRQVDYIRRSHDVVSLEQALETLRRGVRLRRPLAVLAFDDGYRTVWEFARPILARRALPACCFVCTGFVGTEARLPHDDGNPVRAELDLMGWTELDTLCALGWTVGAHTVSHARLATCSGETLRREIVEPAVTIRHKLGRRVAALAYPYGGRDDVSDEARSLMRDYGYATCLSNFGGENLPPADLMDLKRIDIGGDYDALGWKILVNGWDPSRWRRWGDTLFTRGAASVAA